MKHVAFIFISDMHNKRNKRIKDKRLSVFFKIVLYTVKVHWQNSGMEWKIGLSKERIHQSELSDGAKEVV